MKRRKRSERAEEPQPAPRAPSALAIGAREWFLLGVVVAVGIGLRVWALAHSAVEHFDEGVYASNLFFGPPEYAYPMQRFYAPPLLPALIETGMIVGLPANVAALLPSFLAGCGTIAAVWWVGRSWFGPAAGLAAATLVALSDFHIAYSAAALTDVLLGLWLVLAVDAMWRSLQAIPTPSSQPSPKGRGSGLINAAFGADLRWAIGAGVFTGLAWWTKYNGWLPLAIGGAALPVLWLLLRPPSRQLQTWIACFAVTALVSVMIWSPYVLSLQEHGGYRPIAENHAKYVVGLAGWLDAAARQITNQYVMEGLTSKLAVSAAVALPAFLVRRSYRENLWLVYQSLGWGLLALLFTTFAVLGVAAIVGFARTLVAFHAAQRLDENWHRRATGLVFVGVWCSGLLLATPFYFPYARLVMPWLLAASLGTAINWIPALPGDVSEPKTFERPRWHVFVGWAFLLTACCWSGLFLPHEDFFDLENDRRGVQRVAELIRKTDIHRGARAVYVFGEPAMYFQLAAAGEGIVVPVQKIPEASEVIEGKAVPTFLVAGPHADRDPQFRERLAEMGSRWQLVQSYEYVPSKLVWLDLHDPRKGDVSAKEHAFRLYELQP